MDDEFWEGLVGIIGVILFVALIVVSVPLVIGVTASVGIVSGVVVGFINFFSSLIEAHQE